MLYLYSEYYKLTSYNPQLSREIRRLIILIYYRGKSTEIFSLATQLVQGHTFRSRTSSKFSFSYYIDTSATKSNLYSLQNIDKSAFLNKL